MRFLDAQKYSHLQCRDESVKSPEAQHKTSKVNAENLSQHPKDLTENGKTMLQENRDWLLDSAVGRWLGVHRLAVTNLTLLKVLLWLVLLGLFSELDFGLPFFLLSLFYWLYEGLRSPAARRPGELSAYSVFNPDCQPILGTLTAEQLEGEMGYRPLNNRATT
ncbi:SAYSvFN domain-containing protein 1 [Bagarius yarrelli]|uniref:SAYSvFN domain-containing protein 1 n=1 Tax=Bagarius yarrelli TaxID=175774 RepID=A0A556TT24_BAGYA|nr:SAYSvFN domain-containing protein 1 [Bagarius yarrelli]